MQFHHLELAEMIAEEAQRTSAYLTTQMEHGGNVALDALATAISSRLNREDSESFAAHIRVKLAESAR